jgi:hypothetical protein
MRTIKEYFKSILNENNTSFELTKAVALKGFKEFNDKYFGGQLKPIKIELVEDVKEDYGDFIFGIDYINQNIKSISITLNKEKIHSYEEFRNILVHEMVHYYVNEQYKPDKTIWDCLLIDEPVSEKLEILGISDNMNHKGKWKMMADKLTQNYDELFIETKKEDFELTEDFIKNYKKNHKIYFINDNLFVLKIGSEKYNLMQKFIKTGKCKLPNYTGDLYELIIDEDIQHFDYFILYLKHYNEGIYNMKKITIDRLHHENYFEMKFICSIVTDIEENINSNKLIDQPKEVLEELNILYRNLSM